MKLMPTNTELTAQVVFALVYAFFIAYLMVWVLALSKVFTPGVFVHLWDIRFRQLHSVLWLVFVMKNLYIVIVGLLQTAMLSEWMRIFCPTPAHRNASYWTCGTSLAFTLIWWLMYLCILNSQCNPYGRIWDKTLSGTCNEMGVYDVFSALINLVLDLIIASLFLGRIGQMRRLRQVGRSTLELTLTLGIVVCGLAIGRLMYTLQSLGTHDSGYEGSAVALWALGEMSCGFIAFGVPWFEEPWGGFKVRNL
ncbi:hypothetical protein F5Y07DRAFT_405627 [Xylaria sp. FL0933]|nr:hypothetical protein F5Y07DRAFT_405627 [Xylaria sp. FL0933]